MFHAEHFRQFSNLLISYKIINSAQVTAGAGVALERRDELIFVLSQGFALGPEIVVEQVRGAYTRPGPVDFAQGRLPGTAVPTWMC